MTYAIKQHLRGIPRGQWRINKNSIFARGLIGCWPMQEASVTTARNIAESRGIQCGDLAQQGTAQTIVTTEFGTKAIDFNDDKYIATLSSTPTAGYTVCVWSKLDNDFDNYYWGMGEGATNKGPHCGRSGNTTYVYNMWGGGTSSWVANMGDAWSRLVCTYDGTTAIMYINGINRASVAQTFLTPTNHRFIAGALPSLTNEMTTPAFDWRLYDRAWSAQEVALDYSPRGRWDLYRQTNVIQFPVAAAPGGGLSIPVAMHQYARLRA